MAVLKDGIYEAEDLFYADGGFTVKVEAGEMEFFGGAGSANRLKLTVLDPETRLPRPGEVVRAPSGFTSERCEFDKSLVKTILSARTEDEMKRRIGEMMKALVGCSLFESAFVMRYMSDGGLVFMVQDRGAPAGKSPGGVKPDRTSSAPCRIIMQASGYSDFRRSIHAKAEHGDPEDIRLYNQLMKAPHNLKPVWEWAETDSKECLAILKANPLFKEYLSAQSEDV